MTITPDTALGGDLEFLAEAESARADELRRDSENAASLTEVGLALGGAFLFYRLYMVKRLRRELRPAMTGPQLAAAVDYHFRKFVPIWSYVTLPAMVRAMVMGSPDSGIPDELVFAMADDYARRVGLYLNETSKEALLEGFNAYTNKRQNRVIAGTKALDGFGMTKKQTRAMVAKKDRPPVASARAISLDRDREMYAETAVFSRALSVGDNEAYAATQHGKQIGWMYLQREGRISVDAKRVWVTARDEKTCKVCGPMHRKSAPIDEPFETDRGEVWSPGLHPNCRCTMTLRGVIKPSLIKKDLYGAELAEFNRKVRRSDDGRFTFKPQVKERVSDPRVEEMMSQAERVAYAQERFTAPERFAAPEKFSVAERFSVGEKFNPSQAASVTAETFTPDKAVFGKYTPEKVRALEERLEATPEKTTIAPVFFLDRKKAPPLRPAPGHTGFDEDAEFFDTGSNVWNAWDPLDLDEVVVTKPTNHFYTPDDIDNDITPVHFANVAERLTREVIARGHYTKTDENGKKIAIQASPGAIKRAIQMELAGDTDSPDERELAELLGVKREEHVVNLYVLSMGYDDASDEGGYISAPGPYLVEMIEPVRDHGYPIRRVRLRPMNADEYEEWLITRHDQ